VAKKAVTKKTNTKKKTTKASSKKKTTKKSASASAKKKSTSKRAAASSKKTTRKSSKKATSKKSPTKKASTRKKTSKAPARKTSAKKPPARKPSKKSTSKSTTRKTSASKAPVRKPSNKKSPARKPSKKAASEKTDSKSPKSSKSKADSKAAVKERWKSSLGGDITSSVDAASRLAAAAGLRPLHERQTTAASTEEYKRLTKTPFRKRELDKFKEILRLKRAQVTGDVNDMETEALIGRGSGSLSKLPQHMADAGSDTYDQTLNLDLAAGQRKLLKEIDDALARIENKTYGICELLGKPISKERLENTPWARYSIEAARRKEMLGY